VQRLALTVMWGAGEFVKEYCERSQPSFVVGEYWDSLKYKHGTVEYDQDQHRQRIINWLTLQGLRPRRHHEGHPVFGRGDTGA
jgi:hypothetical protein